MLPFKVIVTQFIVTTIIFYIESLVHYNYGKNGKICIDFPEKTNDNNSIIGIVLFFSIISTVITSFLTYYLQSK